jgi:hypothetical protein
MNGHVGESEPDSSPPREERNALGRVRMSVAGPKDTPDRGP